MENSLEKFDVFYLHGIYYYYVIKKLQESEYCKIYLELRKNINFLNIKLF